MKKLITLFVTLISFNCFASDSLPQEVTSEVFTKTEVINQEYTTNTEYASYRPVYQPVQYYRPQPRVQYSYNLKPITVHTGKTVTVQDHYDVYQPKVIYQKVNSYTTTQTCEYCY